MKRRVTSSRVLEKRTHRARVRADLLAGQSVAASPAGQIAFSPASLTLRGMPAASRVQRVAVFPGQFDPITNGHLDVIRRGTRLFDELIVGVGINPEKRELFTIDERVEIIRTLLKDTRGVRVERFTGLTVDFVRQVGATVILRGIRDVSDLRYEFQLALANRAVGDVETVFIMTGDQYALTSSSLIRQVVSLGGDVKSLKGILPELVVKRLQQKQRNHGFARSGPDAPAT
jgi:pantetheine-phosphate adenylyltransferase